MATRLFLCPSTGLWVQAWFVGNGSVDGDETYKGHMVNPKTGKVLGADEETNRPTPHLPPWFGACRCTKGKRTPRDSRGFLELTMKGNPGITVP